MDDRNEVTVHGYLQQSPKVNGFRSMTSEQYTALPIFGKEIAYNGTKTKTKIHHCISPFGRLCGAAW